MSKRKTQMKFAQEKRDIKIKELLSRSREGEHINLQFDDLQTIKDVTLNIDSPSLTKDQRLNLLFNIRKVTLDATTDVFQQFYNSPVFIDKILLLI